MARVLLHCPLNISRSLEEMLKEFGRKLEEKHGISISVEPQPHRPTEEGPFKAYAEKGEIPDVIVGHVNDFAELPDGFLQEHFRALPGRFPMRPELEEAGFRDKEGYFHPFVVIPFAMFYNVSLLSEAEAPKAWTDLFAVRWREKIRMPDDYRMVSKIICTFLKANYPDRFSEFRKNVVNAGAPIDVVNDVDGGSHPVGITNIAFARVSRYKNTRLIWPEDGIFCMPQAVIFSKSADDSLLEIGDYLFSEPVQQYLALQAFVPASPETALSPLFTEHPCRLQWESWENYLSVIKGTAL